MASGHYYADGSKKRLENYDKDKKSGKLIRWYANGQKSQEEFYKNDEKHGKFKYWFDNGRLEKEEKFSNGIQTDGKHYDYFDN